MLHLKMEVRFKAAEIAVNLLGRPNSRLSNGRNLRFGNKGSLSVGIAGDKTGFWYDFSSEKGGEREM